MAEQMRLTLSPEKTRSPTLTTGLTSRVPHRAAPLAWEQARRHHVPKQRAFREVMQRVKTLTTRSTTNLSLDQLIHVLNPILRGWTSYHRHAAAALFRLPDPLPVVASDAGGCARNTSG